MSIEVVAIGNEVLRGMVVNTNAAYLSRRLVEESWDVARQTTLPDEAHLLIQGLQEALSRSSIVIATGGLGPTMDDNTAACAQKVFSQTPQKIPNPAGSAPGFIFTDGKRTLFLLPGIPQEMETMFEETVVPYLQKHFPPSKKIYREAIYFYLMRETDLDPLLRKLQQQYDLDIGIYPSYSVLSVVLRSEDENKIKAAKAVILNEFAASLLPASKIEEALHHWMIDHRKTLSFAESCTGGFMASQITALPGASDYFLGSIVAYSNHLKEKLLGVSPATLKKHGAVSGQTVEEMLKGLLERTGSDYGIAVSGIAGPAGGTPEKPVGTIWYALGMRGEKPLVETFNVKGSRQTVILRTTKRLLSLLWKEITTH